MKLKKTCITLVVITLSCTLFAGHSFAGTWASCRVKKAGYYGPTSTVRLLLINCNIDPSNGKGGWVSLKPEGSREMLVAALSALELGHTVGVEFTNKDEDEDRFGFNSMISVLAVAP